MIRREDNGSRLSIDRLHHKDLIGKDYKLCTVYVVNRFHSLQEVGPYPNECKADDRQPVQ